jgi:hypothetical protein
MHPGTNMVTTYYGMMWWDNETERQDVPEGAAKSFSRGRSNQYSVI